MRKGIWLILVCTLAVLVCSACTGDSSNPDEGRTGKAESGEKVSQYAGDDGRVWLESWKTETASGVSVQTDIHAPVSVPELSRMSVVEVGRYRYSSENKKRIAESLFGDEIYYYVAEKLPGSELERLIGEERERMEYKEETLKKLNEESYEEQKEDAAYREEVERDWREAKEALETYEELSKKAPDDFVRLRGDDFEGDSYMGRKDGIEYCLNFKEENFYLEPLEQKDLVPEKGRDKNGEYSCYEVNQEEGTANECKWKEEEAEKLVQDFLKAVGFSDLIREEEKAIMWDLVQNGELCSDKTFVNGWRFSYGFGVDQMSFRSFGEASEVSYPLDCGISVTVTDQGISEISCSAPIEILSVTPGVKMLPFADIQEIVRKEMGGYAQYCQEKGKARVTFNRMELVYYRMSDPKDSGRFTYIPAWRLRDTGKQDMYFVVNAMDGTVIGDWELEWSLSTDWIL